MKTKKDNLPRAKMRKDPVKSEQGTLRITDKSATKPGLENSFWPDGSRLVISVSMQFEGGLQPQNIAGSSLLNLENCYSDLPPETWHEYSIREGIPRMLDLWEKLGIKVTSHMVGAAVLKYPELAKEICDRGHEAAARRLSGPTERNMLYGVEKNLIEGGAKAIALVTGQTVVGYNANCFRPGVNTLTILRELGFTYHIDDYSRDEPFVIQDGVKDFAVVPYTVRNNDLLSIEHGHFSADQFLNQLKMEFELLYEESAFKRRMMSVSFHDRIGGTPQIIQAAKEFFTYAVKQPGVAFKRKDEIARIVLDNNNTFLRAA
jgi:peptidoglycan/xylan/chitin deacetylase (PgdA/CDA1 family)